MKTIAILMVMLLLVSGLAMADNVSNNGTNLLNKTDGNLSNKVTARNQINNNKAVPQLYNEKDKNNDKINNTPSADTKDVEIKSEEIKVGNEEIKAFYGNGAKIRVLQLIKHTTKNVLVGTEVIQYLDSQETKDNANAILNEMSSIISNLENYNFENKTKNQMLEDFLSYKASATDLSKTFRDLVGPELSDEDRAQLKETIKGIDQNDIKPLDEEIKSLIHEYNANNIQKQLKKMNINDSALIEKIRNGELTSQEAKEKVGKFVSEMNKEQRKKLANNVREEITKKNEYNKEIKKQILETVKEKAKSQRARYANKIRDLKMQVKSGNLTEADIAARTRANSDKYKLIAQERRIIKNNNLSIEEKQKLRDSIDYRLGIQEQEAIRKMMANGTLNAKDRERIQAFKNIKR